MPLVLGQDLPDRCYAGVLLLQSGPVGENSRTCSSSISGKHVRSKFLRLIHDYDRSDDDDRENNYHEDDDYHDQQ